jgi:hypothetical protein
MAEKQSIKIQAQFDEFKEEEIAYVRDLKAQCVFTRKHIHLGDPDELLKTYKEFLDRKYKFFEETINSAKKDAMF